MNIKNNNWKPAHFYSIANTPRHRAKNHDAKVQPRLNPITKYDINSDLEQWGYMGTRFSEMSRGDIIKIIIEKSKLIKRLRDEVIDKEMECFQIQLKDAKEIRDLKNKLNWYEPVAFFLAGIVVYILIQSINF